MEADIRFPHLGIILDNVGKSISIGGFSIAYYGIIIAFGMVAGFLMASWQAGRLKQDKEMVLDLALWDYYSQNPIEIFNIRGGGMAIYGGVIGGVVTTFVFARVKKLSFYELLDIACTGLLVGQIFGRWGNFFNREAFGGYTDNLFAMQLKRSDVRAGDITNELLSNLVTLDGTEYIQVHPTFLYESLWNIAVLLVILWYTKKRKFQGELFLMYLCGYGLGRFWIEGLRVDQLKLFGTQLAVSQLLSVVLVVGSLSVLLFRWVKRRQKKVGSK